MNASASFTYDAQGLAATDRLGAALAKVVPPGTTVALSGTLGAGKTRLVQAMAVGIGVPAEVVVSPTFVLCQEYNGRKRLVHLDAYRIADDDEFLQLGVDEYFASDAIVLIEWAERVQRCLPAERLEIEIESLGETSRRFHVRAIGQRYADVIARLKHAVG
jgi:tRNA threonylcarbamoyladenosine biosynthesis protein TsaE